MPVPVCEKLPAVWEILLPKVEIPLTVKLPVEAELRVARPEVESVEREVLPVTPNVPPNVVAPVPTVRVLDPVTEVLPLSVTPPVPVEKAPVPF